MNNTKTLAIVASDGSNISSRNICITQQHKQHLLIKRREEDHKKTIEMVTQLPYRRANETTESGFDNSLAQECQNTICTHPAFMQPV